MKKIIQKKLQESIFLSRVSILVGGTAVGQLIAILSLPVLTRLYSPDSFSILAVYSATLSLITVIACLRFEIAIPLPKSSRMAAALFLLAVVSVIFISILTALIVFVFPDIINKLTENKISQFLWLIPFGVLLIGMYNALQYWSTRKKQFSLISKTRITQSISGTSIKLGTGFLMGGWSAGLVFGQLISEGAGLISLGVSLVKNDLKIFKKIKLAHLRLAFKRYDKFPKYSTFEAFANTGGIQIPIILIAYYAVGAEAGYLMIAMQLLSAPISLIGSAVAQVYLSEASERYHRGELKKFTNTTILNLAKVAIIPLLVVAIMSPHLMSYFLGEEWQRTGVLISWMVPWFLVQFITSPVSMSLHITGNQKTAFLLQVMGLIVRVGSVLFAVKHTNAYVSEVYAISSLFFYIIYLMVVLRIISKVENEQANPI